MAATDMLLLLAGSAALTSAEAVTGGLVAARIAPLQDAARWIYRLIIGILVGELGQLAFAGIRL